MPAKKDLKTNTKKRLVLLDAHALLHRAYHALPDFMNQAGMPTGGLYGFTSMIIRIAADWKPDYIVACYDLPQPTFRHQAYEGYKGTRAKTDDALVTQIKASRELCEKLGIPIYDTPGFEADDMLGTIVEQEKKNKDMEILIATGDMDSLQLVDDKKVRVFTQKKANETVVYDEDAVIERFGFGPELLPDYKGLRGDPSDNIIGVPGIGEKTATELILKFGKLEDMYKKLHKDRQAFLDAGIKERMVGLLEEHEEGAIFSKTLATIRRDAPIEFKVPERHWCEECVPENVEALMREYGFRSLITRLKEAIDGSKNSVERKSGVDRSRKTTPPSSAESDAISPNPAENSVPAEQLPKDIGIAMWLLNSDMTNITTSDVLAYTRKPTIDEARTILMDEIKKQNLEFVFEKIECPLIPILNDMQSYGILIDADFLKKLSEKLHKELIDVEQRIYKHAGHEFNIGSPKQLGEIVFGEMMLHTNIKGFKVKKTASGTYSTREEDLQKLEGIHPIISDIFQYRELAKLLSTYIDSIPTLLDGASRLHPELIQAGTTTGRFSSQNPNIQNIPIKSEMGREIRQAFIAPKGSSIIAADYSQIELRVAAMMSGDPTFVETFRTGSDIHASVASRVFHVAQNEVSNNQRRQAKVINFGILYGMGVTALQKNLGTNRAEAQEFYDNYFRELPKLSDYMDDAIMQAKKNGFTTTLFGRRRNFTGLKSPLPYLRAMAERAAGNAPIQGTAADMIKLAMIRVEENLKKENLDSKVHMTMQIHDELVFECEDSVLDQAKKIIKESMEHVLDTIPFEIKNLVPIEVSVGSGKNWGETKG
ncbi:MAG: polA [Patescibacteria group bacterium]|nr:polA [Patescibacteria group bacterium]